MEESWDSETEQSLEEYQRDLRERANESIQELKDTFELSTSSVKGGTVPFTESPHSLRDMDQALEELQQSHAANQLKALLREQEMKVKGASSPRRRNISPSGNPTSAEESSVVAAVSDLVPIVHDQSQYIRRLEAEVKFCKEEMLDVKQRIRVVVHENEELHEVLKSRVLQQTTGAQTQSAAPENLNMKHVPGRNNSFRQREVVIQSPLSSAKPQVTASSDSAAALELHKWHLELERLKLLYDSRTETLEAQTVSLRKDLAESQKNCEDLRGRLRHQESVIAANNTNRVGGLCLKCAQHEAVLAQTHSNVHMQTIARLTKERDELMSALVMVRKNLSDMQHRESKAYEQVKKAMVITEEANLEKTMALIHCDQLKSEIERKNERSEKDIAARQQKMACEKQAIRKEMRKDREELASTVMALSCNVAELESLRERLTGEKTSIANQLEEAQNQLSAKEKEMTQVCAEMRHQLNQVKMRKDEAEKEFREQRSKMARALELKDQEIEKLGLELSDNRQRLEQAQQDATAAKEECLRLTELLGKCEHQLHLTRVEKDDIQQSLGSDARALAWQGQQRAQELTQKMQQMAAQHERTVNELDSLLTSQNTFIAKLKEECHVLASKLEEVTGKSRLEVGQLCQENEYVNTRLVKLQKHHDELEEQCIQHGRMHERMKLRLQQLDKHCQKSSHQLVELLDQQNQLMKERQVLIEENRVIKAQLPSVGVQAENKLTGS